MGGWNGKIESLTVLRCGSCRNRMRRVFPGEAPGWTEFPALAFYIRHRTFGGVLFDAGYSHAVFAEGLLPAVYNRLNPTVCGEGDLLPARLEAQGIPMDAVQLTVLSHGHPDHMGGLCFLQDKPLAITGPVLQSLLRPRLRDLVFPAMAAMLPQTRRVLEKTGKDPVLSGYFDTVYDVLGDGSLLAPVLEGHAGGQIGLYLPEQQLLLGADSAWGGRYLEKTETMRLLPRLIQRDFRAYAETARRLLRLLAEHPEVKVLFSHEDCKEGAYGE